MELDPKTNPVFTTTIFIPSSPGFELAQSRRGKGLLDATRFWYRTRRFRIPPGCRGNAIRRSEAYGQSVLPGTDKFGRPNMDEKYDKKLRKVHDVMRKLRGAADEYWFGAHRGDWTSHVSVLKDYYGQRKKQRMSCQLPMDLMMTGFQGTPCG